MNCPCVDQCQHGGSGLANRNITLLNFKDVAERARGMFGGENYIAPPTFPPFLSIAHNLNHNIRTVKNTLLYYLRTHVCKGKLTQNFVFVELFCILRWTRHACQVKIGDKSTSRLHVANIPNKLA